ncbi:WDR44 family protein [Megaselia abdita]
MTSLGRVGRILAGSIDPSTISVDRESLQFTISSSSLVQGPNTSNKTSANNSQTTTPESKQEMFSKPDPPPPNKIVLQEPDVIASTKLAHSKTTDSISLSGPIPPSRPPRKNKNKSRKLSSSSSEQFNMNEGMKLLPIDTDIDFKLQSKQKIPITKTASVKSVKEVAQQIRYDIEKDFESSLTESCETIKQAEVTTTSAVKAPTTLSFVTSTKNPNTRISQSLGNSSCSVYSKPSPSNSAKSNSAPGRVRYFDFTAAEAMHGLSWYKSIQAGYIVEPKDEESNRAKNPSKEEFEKIIVGEFIPRSKLAGTGSNSLGNEMRYQSFIQRCKSEKERRKSAGDEDVFKQMNMFVRMRTDSGKHLTDIEILEQVPVKNLDTGENMPLSEVKSPPIPDGWNPLSLHIHKLTSHLEVSQKESDEESVVGIPPISDPVQGDEEELGMEDEKSLKKKTAKIKRFFGTTMRKTVDKAKSIASEVSNARHKEDVADIVDVMNPEQNIKIKASNSNKGPYDFTKLDHVQDLSGEHEGAVWCMKFSCCGRLLATAGQDKILRIWVLKDAYPFFQDMRTKYNADQKSSPTPSQESLVSQQSFKQDANASCSQFSNPDSSDNGKGPFMSKAFCSYIGHTSDLLDVSWSKNYFILSSSMDKTVRLWHISRNECLCCFQHIDFVTAIAFHPRDDRYFLSGSLDGKLRLWNIPDKKVALWNEVDGQTNKLITAANFCQNGKFAVVGTYDGRCIFYTTDQLKYHTQIHVRSTRGKNRIGRKISGIEPLPGEDKILVTSNDSRVRLYDLRDLNLSCKYKGYLNVSSQIKASFSHDGKFIIVGSENQCIYIWKTNHDYSKLSSVRRDRSDFWEGIKAHNATVTCAIFAPHPEAIIKPEKDEISIEKTNNQQPDPLLDQRKKSCGYVMVSGDFDGKIKVFINKTKPKHSSLPYTAIE